jgi:hypothetical protein
MASESNGYSALGDPVLLNKMVRLRGKEIMSTAISALGDASVPQSPLPGLYLSDITAAF